MRSGRSIPLAEYKEQYLEQGRRKKRKHPENDLDYDIRKYLDLALPSDAVHAHIPNGGYKLSVGELAFLKRSGYKAGLPDHFVAWRGKWILFETKPPGKAISDNQERMFASLEAAGFPVAVCRSVDDVERLLKERAVPVRARLL